MVTQSSPRGGEQPARIWDSSALIHSVGLDSALNSAPVVDEATQLDPRCERPQKNAAPRWHLLAKTHSCMDFLGLPRPAYAPGPLGRGIAAKPSDPGTVAHTRLW